MISFWALPPWLTYAVGCNLPNVIIQRNVTFCVKLFGGSFSVFCFHQTPNTGLYPVWHIMWGCVCWVSANIQTIFFIISVSLLLGGHVAPHGWGVQILGASVWVLPLAGRKRGRERRDCVFHIDKQPDSGGNTRKPGRGRVQGSPKDKPFPGLSLSPKVGWLQNSVAEKSPSCSSSSYSPTPNLATHTMWSNASWILEIHSSALKNTMQMNEVNKEIKGLSQVFIIFLYCYCKTPYDFFSFLPVYFFFLPFEKIFFF